MDVTRNKNNKYREVMTMLETILRIVVFLMTFVILIASLAGIILIGKLLLWFITFIILL